MRLLPKDPSQSWTRYVWLIYIVPMFIQPVLTGEARDWWITGLSVAVFLPLYFVGFWLQGRRVLWVVGAIVAIGCLTAPLNPGSASFFIYAAAFLGQLGPPRVGALYLVGILGVLLLEAWLVGFPRYSWVWASFFTLMVGGINIHYSEVARRQAKLKLAQGEVERLATMAERERIARDLHDVLGHTLSLITIKAGLASRLVGSDPERAAAEMGEVEEIARSALDEVRQAVEGYRFLSLGAEVARAKVALAAAGIESAVETSPHDLASSIESAVALALREAVTNVVRHARADRCTIRYRQADGELRLEVVDDGRGGDAPDGSGLAGMRERIEAIGGRVRRDGSRGTRLTVVVPVDEPARAREAAGA